MTDYTFTPHIQVVATVPPTATIAELAYEQGMYSATPAFVRLYGGPIANRFLDAIPDWYHSDARALGLYVNVDVRIHRLYPSDIPAYPGWHCDGEFRETYFGQPDLDRIQVHQHLIGTVSSHAEGVSNTQFLDAPFTFRSDRIDPDHGLWQQVNEQLERQRVKTTRETRDGELTMFDSWTLHRAMPAKIRGWRLFFRASMWHKPNLGDGGMLSKQEQVYKYVGDAGW